MALVLLAKPKCDGADLRKVVYMGCHDGAMEVCSSEQRSWTMHVAFELKTLEQGILFGAAPKAMAKTYRLEISFSKTCVKPSNGQKQNCCAKNCCFCARNIHHHVAVTVLNNACDKWKRFDSRHCHLNNTFWSALSNAVFMWLFPIVSCFEHSPVQRKCVDFHNMMGVVDSPLHQT